MPHTRSQQASFFQGASNILIEGGSFIANVQGYSGIDALSHHIASDAIHNSAARHARQDPPRCHPLTRKDVLGDIMAWIEDSSRKKSVLWLNGSAGSGKSAVMQTLAERCEERGLLAASFFFGGQDSNAAKTNTNTGVRLFATIAYQLAIAIDELQEHVDAAVRADPSIATKALQTQMERLILHPIHQLLLHHRLDDLRLPPVILIDALDDGPGARQQQTMLRLLLHACSTSRDSAFPFCVVLSSRVDEGIQSVFGQFPGVVRTVGLDDVKSTQQDIRTYLRAEFDRIRESDPVLRKRMRLLGSTDSGSTVATEKPWPSEYVVNLLASKSSRQFIYASTVIDFVSNPDCSPEDQLSIVLALLTGRADAVPPLTPTSALCGPLIRVPSSSSSNSKSSLASTTDVAALNPLDAMYRDILGKCPNQDRTLAVLGHLLAMTQTMDAYAATWGAPLNTGIVLHVIDHFLSLNLGDSERAIRRLQPLISLSRLKDARLKNATQTSDEDPSMGYQTGTSVLRQNTRKRTVDEQISSLAEKAIKFNHASLSDFLQHPSRAGRFAIALSEIHAQITIACLRVMSRFKSETATQDEYLVWVYAVLFWCHHCTRVKSGGERAEIITILRQFDVPAKWILPQTLPPPGVSELRLREALRTFGVQDLKDCPGQCRWSFGEPDLQSLMKDLHSVTAWVAHTTDAGPHCLALAKEYNSAFSKSFLHHIDQSPNKGIALFVLGLLSTGEVSERMILDALNVSPVDFVNTMQSTRIFLYRYSAPNKPPDSQHSWVGLRSEAFSRFLDSKHASRRILNSSVYEHVALTFLRLAKVAVEKEWDPVEYTHAWTQALSNTKGARDKVIDGLAFATSVYLSSSFLRRGLRQHHATRVLAWINKTRPISNSLSIITNQWLSPPIWQTHWHLDNGHNVEEFPFPTPYKASLLPSSISE